MRARILILALGTFAVGTDTFVIAGILPNIAHSLDIGLSLAGLAVTAFALIYGLGAPVLAALAGNLERRRLLLISLGILALANLLGALANSLALLLAARILAAIGAALYTPTASAVAATLAPPEERGRALALVMTGLTASTILGVPMGIMIASWSSWEVTLLFVALLSVLALLGILALFPRVATPPAASLGTRLAFLRRPGLLLILFQTLLCLTGMQIVATYLRPVLQQLAHIDDVTVSAVLLCFGIAGVVGGMLSGYSADRWGDLPTLIGSVGLLSLSLVLLPLLAVTPAGAILICCLWGIAGWAILPAQQHRLIAFEPGAAGIILSLNSSAIYLGITCGSAIGSVLIQSSSPAVMSWLAAAWEIVVLALILVSTRRSVRQTREPHAEPHPEALS